MAWNSPRTLHALRELIEVELERSLLNHWPAVQPRMPFALAWLERHGHEPQPVSRLAEYLQISHSSLDRLFKKELRMSVSIWLHGKKMRRAEILVREQKLSRKEIAFELGYAHANDFSRAWSKWIQQTSKLRTGP